MSKRATAVALLVADQDPTAVIEDVEFPNWIGWDMPSDWQLSFVYVDGAWQATATSPSCDRFEWPELNVPAEGREPQAVADEIFKRVVVFDRWARRREAA